MINFEEVNNWNELVEIMGSSLHNVYSTLHICWGLQAGLYHHFGIPKYPLDKKMEDADDLINDIKQALAAAGF